MATAISRIISKTNIMEVRIATVGKENISTKEAVAMSCISRWPAVKLAVSRTPSARGRINRLIVSMIIRIGIRGAGVPSGNMWPRVAVGWFRNPINTVASHKGTASPKFKDSWVVGVKVYGRRPSIFKKIKNTINEVRIKAHLWPPIFKGVKSCDVNWLIDQFCVVKSRLLNHRRAGVGNSNHGRRKAKYMRGMPSRVGLINWSKKLIIMVRIRGIFLAFECFEMWAHLGINGLMFLELQLLEGRTRRRLKWQIKELGLAGAYR